MSMNGTIFLTTLPIPILAAAFWQWRVYSLYKLLGARVMHIGYYWFSFQFQNPNFCSTAS